MNDDHEDLSPDDLKARAFVAQLAKTVHNTGGTFTIVNGVRKQDGAPVQMLCIIEPTTDNKGKMIPIAVLLPDVERAKAEYKSQSQHSIWTIRPRRLGDDLN
jgi:hypothetical protein